MPHHRNRLLESRLKHSMKHSPIVGILGQRQTGKTTLLEQLVPRGSYVTLDKATYLNSARTSPEAFIDRGTTVLGIDECQLSPELFPALKEHVRVNKRPGQFVLTGSVRFTSRKLIRESLTGRIVSHELLPLSLAELHEYDMVNVFELFRKSPTEINRTIPEKLRVLSRIKTEEFLLKGGLPGICFYREAGVRDERFTSHLDTLLQRDLHLVFDTTLPSDKLWRALRFLAKNQGKPFSFSEASRETRISTPSLQRLIPAFEALFLIRRVTAIGDRKKDRFFLEDQGMASFLYRERDPEMDLLRLVFSQVLAKIKYLFTDHGEVQSFETRSGVVVPLVLDVNGEKIGLIPVPAETPDARAIFACDSFLRNYPKAVCIILTTGREITLIGKQRWVLPFQLLI